MLVTSAMLWTSTKGWWPTRLSWPSTILMVLASKQTFFLKLYFVTARWIITLLFIFIQILLTDTERKAIIKAITVLFVAGLFYKITIVVLKGPNKSFLNWRTTNENLNEEFENPIKRKTINNRVRKITIKYEK